MATAPSVLNGSRKYLTPREQEVVRLLADGDRDPEIAEKLCISVKTVEAHVQNAKGATGSRNRVQLAVKWARGQV